ncbi:MAG TPA: polyprenyl synthetase family protein [Ornithinimicrobium sp.]|uniref:polyprenyl synthetase family protein n=1 Tax=Ornithinimicrobium sp. TaxID=1977084 RepID=UPI002B4957F4|nr:polyprenyl synthetase family protein [Ornithinimicrobium sp.]HKJ11659.1 polyprenyl synthetase family protein [Ornithinimicrobium sp.]
MERAPTLLPGAEEDLHQRLFDGLEAVDARLRAVVDHEDPFISEAAGHLAAAGGKRFRPLLTLLCAEVAEGINPLVVEAATGVELTHLASLYHDDVMDEAELRRGVQSANVRYGNATSILVGDLLFGTASSVIAELGPEAVRVQAATFVRLCAGQIRDERPPTAGMDPVDYYRSVLADKTGSLIATSARYGAMFAGAEPRVVELLTAFGERLGIVFQMSDDVLDVVSDASDFGKEPGADLREGKITLPMLFVLSEPPNGDERLRDLLGSPLTDPGEVAEAVLLLREHPAMERARDHLAQLARETRALLDDVGSSPAVEALRGLVDEVVERNQ